MGHNVEKQSLLRRGIPITTVNAVGFVLDQNENCEHYLFESWFCRHSRMARRRS